MGFDIINQSQVVYFVLYEHTCTRQREPIEMRTLEPTIQKFDYSSCNTSPSRSFQF
jgi:hypothetical protein